MFAATKILLFTTLVAILTQALYAQLSEQQVESLIRETISNLNDDDLGASKQFDCMIAHPINLRNGPGKYYDAIDTFVYNEVVTILPTTGPWLKATYNGQTGYLYQGRLRCRSDDYTGPTKLSGTCTIASPVRFRIAPKGHWTIIRTFWGGEVINLISTEDGYTRAEYKGEIGFLDENNLQCS